MRKALRLLFLLAITVSFSGCIIATGPNNRRPRGNKARKARTCHPSHYWNGKRCVHKRNRNKPKRDKRHDHRR